MVKLIDLVNVLQESSSGSDCETAKGKLFPDNPFICRTPSATMVDMHGTVFCIVLDRKAEAQMCTQLWRPLLSYSAFLPIVGNVSVSRWHHAHYYAWGP